MSNISARNIRIDGLDTFKPKRILLCQLRQIGDVVISTGTLRLLHTLYPDAQIDYYTEKFCAPVLENNPYISKIWTIDKSLGFWETLRFYWQVGRDGYDMIFDCQQLPRILWMLFFSNASVKMTDTPPWYRRFFYTHYNRQTKGYAGTCKASPLFHTFGEELWSDPTPQMYTSAEEKAWATQFLAEHGVTAENMLITIDPTHRRETRRWSAAQYGELAEKILNARPEARIFLLYGPGEKQEAVIVKKIAGESESVILTENFISLRQMAAIIEKASLHIGNCSAPRHFAAALNTPSLAVLGATSSAWTCPNGLHHHIAKKLPCQPCNVNHCPDKARACLTDLSATEVAERVFEILTELEK